MPKLMQIRSEEIALRRGDVGIFDPGREPLFDRPPRFVLNSQKARVIRGVPQSQAAYGIVEPLMLFPGFAFEDAS